MYVLKFVLLFYVYVVILSLSSCCILQYDQLSIHSMYVYLVTRCLHSALK
jgi:hypothetical protein